MSMSKYEPLWKWIAENGTDSFKLTFDEIESIAGMTASEAKEKVSSAKLTYSCAYEVVDDTGVVVNVCCKAYYNTKRK